jgi:flavin-dependent dehydrogenase
MEKTDVIIIGASFAGLTATHHLPDRLRVVILDQKKYLNSAIESTGLITQATYDLLADFVSVGDYTPNKITTIGVVAPSYDKYFFSHTDEPWIYSTDTPELVKHMSERLPGHIELRLGAGVLDCYIDESGEYPVHVTYLKDGEKKELRAKFLVGADGSHSIVARKHPRLSQNTKFLLGHEKVFFGDITFGDYPDETVYHYWFGEFSLGYGGWLSPTIIDGKKAFRLGLAKLAKDAKDIKKVNAFIEMLQEKKMIRIDPHCLLVGDAAGFCGAFAADGIKGAVVSGKVAATLISRYLDGETGALNEYKAEMQKHNKLISYYKKQILYRKVWDIMKKDRTFDAMFDLIERQKDDFLNQFCDSKDRHKSLARVVLRFKNIPLLIKYGWRMFLDLFRKPS